MKTLFHEILATTSAFEKSFRDEKNYVSKVLGLNSYFEKFGGQKAMLTMLSGKIYCFECYVVKLRFR